MEKRVVLFLILSLAIIFGYDFIMKELGFIPSPPPTKEDAGTDSGTRVGGAATEPSGPKATNQSADDTARIVGAVEEERAGEQVVDERVEVIDTPLVRVAVSNRGGEITSWALKKYLSQTNAEETPVDLVYPEGTFPGPLALSVADEAITKTLQESVYRVERDFDRIDEDHPTGHLTLTLHNPSSGLRVRKELTFHVDSYVVDIKVTTEGLSEELEVVLGTNFGVVEWGQGFIGMLGPAWMLGDTLEKVSPEPVIEREGAVRWIALQDKYFISVIIPEETSGVKAVAEAERVMSASVKFPRSEGSVTRSFRLFAGPKQFDLLKSFGIGLEDTIDFGWFIWGSWTIVKVVAKPLFYVLRFLYDYTGNYGLAIILLTCGIKLLFVPLQYKSYKSMQGMQKIQPKVVALQEKFKDDRERLNKELLKLYREHKVNPVGGCLPMLLQMPAFVSLFNILYMTVDLRQAPFMLWITDLSVQDPFYVLPVLMGASMVVQQKIMPTTMDPTQAKMMLILPVFMTFLFVTFPSGLVLYWLTNNVLTILQQFVTDRFILKKPTLSTADAGSGDAVKADRNGESEGKKKKAKAAQES